MYKNAAFGLHIYLSYTLDIPYKMICTQFNYLDIFDCNPEHHMCIVSIK